MSKRPRLTINCNINHSNGINIMYDNYNIDIMKDDDLSHNNIPITNNVTSGVSNVTPNMNNPTNNTCSSNNKIIVQNSSPLTIRDFYESIPIPECFYVLNKKFYLNKKIYDIAYGGVYLFKNEDNEKIVVKRLFKIPKKQNIEYINPDNTYKILRTIRESDDSRKNYIVKILDMVEDKNFYYMIYEYIQGVDMFDYYINYIKANNSLPKVNMVSAWFKQIVDAVDFIHSLGIVHRDLALENIMIDENNNIKIIDFDEAMFIKYDDRIIISPKVGRRYYMSPELIEGFKKCDMYANDIFQLGVILLMILTFEKLWESTDPSKNSFLKLILDSKSGEWTYKIKKHKRFQNIPDSALNLIDKILKYEENRIAIKEIQNHNFLKFNHSNI